LTPGNLAAVSMLDAMASREPERATKKMPVEFST